MGNPRLHLKIHTNEMPATPPQTKGAVADFVRELAKMAARRDYDKTLDKRINHTKP